MLNELYEWMLLLVRWLHITTAVSWIGTSVFFMWLDRTFVPNPESKRPGHIGELWMVHGGGFYHVEKLQMGPTKVPERLHWFKWESYWTWMSGMFLMALIFYSGNGSFLLDSSVSSITFPQGILISLVSIFGSWFFYDLLWESSATKKHPFIGHVLTMLWVSGMSYFLCHKLSGRAAYIHVGAILGTWMAGNVFMRIIPRQIKMVQAAVRSEPLNPDWPKNAKNRSTHNTYFTLPIIFIMLSNHFPSTYGHEYGWLILLLLTASGAAIREYFVVRLQKPARAKSFAFVGLALLALVIIFSRQRTISAASAESVTSTSSQDTSVSPITGGFSVKGVVVIDGVVPPREKISVPAGCTIETQGDVYSNEIIEKDRHLQNVLVRIVKGQENLPKGDIPEKAVELDQRGCLYVPRVVALRVGQELILINSDPVFHNVKSISKENENFNLAMPQKNDRLSVRFTKPEISLQTKCSVHPWMGAYVAVMDHPYFSVTDANGAFEISGLAPGTYTLEIWHEIFGTQTKEITVTEHGIDPLTLTYKK